MNAMTLFSQTSFSGTSAPVFLPIGKNGNLVTGLACYPIVIALNDQVQQVLPAETTKCISMSVRSARIQADPRKAAAVAAARKRIGAWMQKEEGLTSHGLTALRLRAGLSQAELANRLGMSQPNVARFEKSPGNPKLDLIKNWAVALGVSLKEVIEAIEPSTTVETN